MSLSNNATKLIQWCRTHDAIKNYKFKAHPHGGFIATLLVVGQRPGGVRAMYYEGHGATKDAARESAAAAFLLASPGEAVAYLQ